MLSYAMCPIIVEETSPMPSFPSHEIASTDSKLQVPCCFGEGFDLYADDWQSSKTVLDPEDPALSYAMCPIIVEEPTLAPRFPSHMIRSTEVTFQAPGCFGDAFQMPHRVMPSSKTVLDAEDPMLSYAICPLIVDDHKPAEVYPSHLIAATEPVFHLPSCFGDSFELHVEDAAGFWESGVEGHIYSCAMCPIIVEETSPTSSFQSHAIASTDSILHVPACFGDSFDLTTAN